MRLRIAAVLLVAALSIPVAAGGAAATPWSTWKHNYIAAHDIHYPQVMGDNPSLATVAWITRQIRERNHSIWMMYQQAHRAWKAQQEVIHARQHSSPPSGGGSYGGGGYGNCAHGYIHDAIVRLFAPGSVSHALFVANRESHCDPYAKNRYSSASGVFQFVAHTWAHQSVACGYGGASVFNGYANVAVAACTVRQMGWGPWGG